MVISHHFFILKGFIETHCKNNATNTVRPSLLSSDPTRDRQNNDDVEDDLSSDVTRLRQDPGGTTIGVSTAGELPDRGTFKRPAAHTGARNTEKPVGGNRHNPLGAHQAKYQVPRSNDWQETAVRTAVHQHRQYGRQSISAVSMEESGIAVAGVQRHDLDPTHAKARTSVRTSVEKSSTVGRTLNKPLPAQPNLGTDWQRREGPCLSVTDQLGHQIFARSEPVTHTNFAVLLKEATDAAKNDLNEDLVLARAQG